ncbi:MAG TPA: ABC transporter permease [Trueperaceae bacterium]|nr:ABC transporter permease [Trueperaceae bacterium]
MIDARAGAPADRRFRRFGRARDVTRRLARHQAGMIGFGIIVLFLVASLTAPILRPYDAARDRHLLQRLEPPSVHHWFGTDELGRDVFTRVWYGGRVSLRVAVVAVAAAAVLGTALGLVAGLAGGWTDTVLVWLADILLAFPGILLAIAIVATLGANLTNALLAISITHVPRYFRIIRSVVLSLRESEFVQSARALGSSPYRVALVHVLPNSLSPLIVQLTLSVGVAILEIASLGFLGLGAQPPTPEWGLMIKAGYRQFLNAPWLSIFPGFAIYLSVLGFNLLGDAVRDVFDPRLGGR